jgi:DNA-binding MarR family transcriptional regulator
VKRLTAEKTDEDNQYLELNGNTLRAYWVLLNSESGHVGVRELQRKLGFSSPALASYHLNKLEEMGLVNKIRGDYRIARRVKVGVLKQFIKLGAFMLPRYTLYATLFTTLMIFVVLQLREFTFFSMLALILAVLGTVIHWYETFRIWRQKP